MVIVSVNYNDVIAPISRWNGGSSAVEIKNGSNMTAVMVRNIGGV